MRLRQARERQELSQRQRQERQSLSGEQKRERKELSARLKADKTLTPAQRKAERATLTEFHKLQRRELRAIHKQERTELRARHKEEMRVLIETFIPPPKPRPIEITGGSCDPIYKGWSPFGVPWGCLLRFYSDRPGWGYFQYRPVQTIPGRKPRGWVRYSMERHNGTTYEWELQRKGTAKNEFEERRAWKGSYEFRGAVYDRSTKKWSYGSFTLNFHFE